MDPIQLNKWLAIYVAETRKVNGESYPPDTIHGLLPLLLENLTIQPVLLHFHLVMEEWADSYVKPLKGSGVLAGRNSNCQAGAVPGQTTSHADDTLLLELHLQARSNSGHAPKCLLLQPHPQDLKSPPKKRIWTLSSEELETPSKSSIQKNTETATKWALENFYSWCKPREVGFCLCKFVAMVGS